MTKSQNIIGSHKLLETTNKNLGWGIIYERKACSSNRYYHAKIYKIGKISRVKTGHKATINHIY